MMEVTQGSTSDQLEVRLTGTVTGDEYDTTLTPAVEAALAENDRIRALILVDEEFEGFDLGAVWADTKLGVSHWSGFDRLALVTDKGWLTSAARMMGALAPCPVQVFSLSQAEDARRWLRESLGAVHIEDLGGPALKVRLLGKLDPEAIAQAEGDLDAKIRARDGFRLLLDLSEFDGWRGVSALSAHFSLVREHAPLAERVAVIGNRAWQKMAQRLAARFLNAEVRFFDEDDAGEAKDWLTA